MPPAAIAGTHRPIENGMNHGFGNTRIPIYAAAVAAIVAYVFIWTWFKPIVFSTTKSDFSCFYRAGRMVIAGDGAKIYDLEAQLAYDQRLGTTFVDGQGQQFSLPFVFPPYTLALFAPLSCLPYRAAELVWYVANVGMLLALPFLLPRRVGSSDKAIAAGLLAPVLFIPAVLALMQGQTSILLLLLFAMAFATLAEGQEIAAGFILAFAMLKPQLMLTVLLALVIWRRWRTLAAMFWTGIALLGLSAAIVGWRSTVDYPRALREFNHLSGALGGEHPESMPNLRGTIHILLPRWPEAAVIGITVALSILLLTILAVLLRQSPALSRSSYSLVVVTACLLSYHAYLHDDALLLLPIILTIDELQCRRWTITCTVLAAALGTLYVLPLLPTSLSATAIQMFVAMTMLATVLALEMQNAGRESVQEARQQVFAAAVFTGH